MKYLLKIIRNGIGYVPQEAYLFPSTILNNIRFGKPSASDNEVVEVFKKFGSHDFIKHLHKGYMTVIGEMAKSSQQVRNS